jgi:hypothetical protein
MTKQLLLIAATATAPLDLRAEPYTTVLGDKAATSVGRKPTRSLGLSDEQLLRAARDSVPIVIVPSDLTRDQKVK